MREKVVQGRKKRWELGEKFNQRKTRGDREGGKGGEGKKIMNYDSGTRKKSKKATKSSKATPVS